MRLQAETFGSITSAGARIPIDKPFSWQGGEGSTGDMHGR